LVFIKDKRAAQTGYTTLMVTETSNSNTNVVSTTETGAHTNTAGFSV
jgi:hypothetical protein